MCDSSIILEASLTRVDGCLLPVEATEGDFWLHGTDQNSFVIKIFILGSMKSVLSLHVPPTFFYRCSSLHPRGTPSSPSPSSYPNHLIISVKPSPLKVTFSNQNGCHNIHSTMCSRVNFLHQKATDLCLTVLGFSDGTEVIE